MKQIILLGSCLVFLCTSMNLRAEEENSWPKKIEKDGTSLIIYQPQVESFTENRLESRAAVSVSNEETNTPVFGARAAGRSGNDGCVHKPVRRFEQCGSGDYILHRAQHVNYSGRGSHIRDHRKFSL